jgi:DNA-binding NarL/FixJ family response regulator
VSDDLSRRGDGLRVVLCDDHALFRQSMARLLRSRGHEVHEAASPGEALWAAATWHPDVVLLDINFPTETGFRVGELVTRGPGAVPVLYLSASEQPDLVASAMATGASGYLLKDGPISTLLAALQAAAAGGKVGGPVAAQWRAPPVDRDLRRRLATLTAREREVLDALVLADGTRELAARLKISPGTARTHVQNVLVKLGVHTRLQAVALVSRLPQGDR